jgi:hypothetical protein
MLWVGGVAVLNALVTRVLRRGDRGEVASFIGNLRIVGPVGFRNSVTVGGFGSSTRSAAGSVSPGLGWGFD